MEFWPKENIKLLLLRVQTTIEKIIQRNQSFQSANEYLLSESAMEKLDAACMLIQTIGENTK